MRPSVTRRSLRFTAGSSAGTPPRCERLWTERLPRGEIFPDADLSAIAAALRGPLYFRRWFSREPIDENFLDLIVQSVLAGCRPSR